ncbi:hypothetical protein [Microcystis sp. T1-4]|uniref:hypothetical protein n=1 Tax=Microcystis sp. T1-4 TaxID=1160279 RepID=UPI00026214F2|nr:hypothetical protein [Microcystis sp. T1-4]CCI34063.1 hypothetical protein MICAI_590027 [Microcystis sp. T1-4]
MPTYLIKQLTGAKCFVSYCREIGRLFWNQPDFLQDYQYRFVSIKNISISKTTTSSSKPSQKSEIHDQPEKMLKIPAQAKHFQELIYTKSSYQRLIIYFSFAFCLS